MLDFPTLFPMYVYLLSYMLIYQQRLRLYTLFMHVVFSFILFQPIVSVMFFSHFDVQIYIGTFSFPEYPFNKGYLSIKLRF